MFPKSFCAAYSLFMNQIFRASLKRKDSMQLEMVFMAKRLDLISLKTKYPNHQCMDYGLGFSNLIPSSYIGKAKPNEKNTEAALQDQEHIALFFTKYQKLFSYLEGNSSLEKYSKRLLGPS